VRGNGTRWWSAVGGYLRYAAPSAVDIFLDEPDDNNEFEAANL
jgi:hypothetical protein